ncbi:conserved hypothetical protein [Mesorhizobium escarrei]|uniref:Uncharacterized protein n=1 Tax=Mesorhizobium escarrei TaxID=666018 RepID=A0ABM9DTA1_9HYPH|nr:conserved hypothetical protein [Mesorhizobium escarrei]
MSRSRVLPHKPRWQLDSGENTLLMPLAAFRPQLAVPSTGAIAYVKPMLIFDGLALCGVGANHCDVF